jgi:hypothetical protein
LYLDGEPEWEHDGAGMQLNVMATFQMKRTLLLFLLVLLLANVVHADWYPNMTYRKSISINTSEVNGTHLNFPVLVRMNDSDLAVFAQSDGSDIIFAGASGSTLLPFDIEFYNGTTGALIAWVLVENVTNVTTKTFYLYYGGENRSQNKSGIWHSNYSGVWHFGETSGTVLNDTKNTTRNMTKVSATAPNPNSSGIIGYAQTFDGSTAATDATFSGPVGNVTMQAWIRPSLVNGVQRVILDGRSDYYARIGLSSANKFDTMYGNGGSWGTITTGTTTPSAGSWYLVTSVSDAAQQRTLLYVNGVLEANQSDTQINSAPAGYYISRYSGGAYYFPGDIDELKITSDAKSSTWIQTEYNNQRQGSSFLLLGAQEYNISWHNASWQYRKRLQINRSMINGTHENFPLLVRLSADVDLSLHAQSDGDDIYFVSNSQKLPHEIEYYNTTTGELVAWVRMPIISSAYDGLLQMYYGNASAANQQNASGVWNASYRGVYHLHQGNGTLNDSTSNGLNATRKAEGSPLLQNPGILGGGQNFSSSTTDSANISDTTDPTEYTFSLWLKATTLGSQNFFVRTDSSGPGVSWSHQLRVDGSNNFVAYTYDGSGLAVGSSTVMATGTSYYLVATARNSGKMRLFVNGREEGTNVSVGTLWTGGDRYIVGGSSSGYGTTNALLDELRVSSIQRSPEWIMTEYNNQVANSTMIAVGNEESISSWHSAFWPYRIPLTVNGSQINGTHHGFPLLIRLSDNAHLAQAANTTAGDILFTYNNSVFSEKLDHEIELYNSTSGVLVAWVRLPRMALGANMTLYLYYGNTSVPNQQSVQDVWSGYRAVWHLRESPASAKFVDSTGYGHNATTNGSSWSSGHQRSGALDGSIFVNSTTNYLNASNTSTLNLGTGFTFGAWVNLSSINTTTYQTIVGKDNSSGTNYRNFFLGVSHLDTSRHAHYAFRGSNCVDGYGQDSTGNITLNEWVYLQATYDGSNFSLYINGSYDSSVNTTDTPCNSFFPVYIGNFPDKFTAFQGGIDEVRLRSAAGSAAWIKTEYENQRPGSTMIALGEMQCSAGDCWYSPAWLYRKNLTVDASQVNGTHTDFPLLVRLASDTELSLFAQADADDLLFTTTNGTRIPHEIELYNASTGQLVAWVRLPSLSNATNTTLYLYYGNSTISSQQNRTGVWESNYRAVWHLSEGRSESAGFYKDSTVYGNNGTLTDASGNTTSNSAILDGTIDFGGENSLISISSSTSLESITSSIATISVWIKPDGYGEGSLGRIIAPDDGVWSDWVVYLGNNSGGGVINFYQNFTTTDGFWRTTASAFMLDNWTHISVVYNGSSASNTPIIYVNGISYAVTTLQAPVGTNPGYAGHPTYLGSNSLNTRTFDGSIDEVRIATVDKSAQWIQTEYNNQKPNSTMISLGLHQGQATTCTAINNTAWVINAQDMCVINRQSYNVTLLRIVSYGTILLQNGSTIQFQNMSHNYSGPLQFLMTGGSVLRASKS